MSKWEMVRLGDVCEEKIDSLSSNSECEIIYIDIASVDNLAKKIISSRTINAKNAPSRAKQILEINDIIVSTVRPNLNAVAVVKQESDKLIVGSTGYCVLRCTNKANPKFVFYFCQSKAFVNKLVKVAKGASYPAVSDKDVKGVKIPLPPLEVQKKIAQTLDVASELITLRKRQLAKLDQLIKATFYDMFGDPVTNEKGWTIKTLHQMIDDGEIIGHLDGNHGNLYPRAEEFVEDGVPYIGANTIFNGKIDFKKAKYLTHERALQFKKGIAKDGDVLFAHNATVGPVALLRTKEEFVILSTSLTYYRCNRQKINNYYLMTYMTTSFFVAQYQKHMGQTTRNQVPITMQKTFFHMVPPLDLQNKFAEIVTKIEEQKALVQQAIDESQYLFDSLMSQYFD